MKRLLFLTGNPSIGKTTVLTKTIDGLKSGGYSTGGMISHEVRKGDARIGFEIQDLATGKRGWLAHVNQQNGPRLGKYYVNLTDLDNIGVNAINEAMKHEKVIAIDEIGPMELFSPKFQEAVKKAIESEKLVIGVVHGKAKATLIDAIRTREDADITIVTFENRSTLHEIILEKALKFLQTA